MSFAFNFHENNPNEGQFNGSNNYPSNLGPNPNSSDQYSVPALEESLETIVECLPHVISYALYRIPIYSPDGKVILESFEMPRREYFDVKHQLMTSDNLSQEEEFMLHHEGTDVKSGQYEGGIKCWECSVDLGSFIESKHKELLDIPLNKFADTDASMNEIGTFPVPFSMIEIGAGTAIPSSVALKYFLGAIQPLTIAGITNPVTPRVVLTITDYNASVIRLVTVPNLLLTWFFSLSPSQQLHLQLPEDDVLEKFDSNLGGDTLNINVPMNRLSREHLRDGEVHITDRLKKAFLKSLKTRGIYIRLLSGRWDDELISLATKPVEVGKFDSDVTLYDLALSSETIYSQDTLPAFTKFISSVLRKFKPSNDQQSNNRELSHRNGIAFIASKEVYFGVGGGLREFESVLDSMFPNSHFIKTVFQTISKSSGVNRVITELIFN